MSDAYRRWFEQLMREIEDMPAREAIASGKAVKCPVCGMLHPGVRYNHVDHRAFCSTECFKKRNAVAGVA